jgi:hypothetical protein
VISDILIINDVKLLSWAATSTDNLPLTIKIIVCFLFRMKGFSLIGSDSIRNNQLNTSSAKTSFMFSREERFRAPPSK